MSSLTPDQREHLKMARRSAERIQETWNLYTMYLSQDKRPADALELAHAAVEVWAEWQDNNEVDPPEINRPDIGDELANMIRRATPMMGVATPDGMMVVAQGTLPAEPEGSADERTSGPNKSDNPPSKSK